MNREFSNDNDAIFSLGSATIGGTIGGLPGLDFHTGTVTTSIPPSSSAVYRIPGRAENDAEHGAAGEGKALHRASVPPENAIATVIEVAGEGHRPRIVERERGVAEAGGIVARWSEDAVGVGDVGEGVGCCARLFRQRPNREECDKDSADGQVRRTGNKRKEAVRFHGIFRDGCFR